jgi:hypothetical protein
MPTRCRFSMGQGATEYLVLLAVVLIIALVGIALLGFFPGTANDSAISSSQLYWQGVPTPFHIDDASIASSGIEFDLANSAAGSETLTGMTINGQPAAVNSIGDPVAFQAGASETVLATDFDFNCTEGQVASLDLQLNYTDENRLALTETGTKNYMFRCNSNINISAGPTCGLCPLDTDDEQCCTDTGSPYLCPLLYNGWDQISCDSGLCAPNQWQYRGWHPFPATQFCSSSCLESGQRICNSNSDCCPGLTCQTGTGTCIATAGVCGTCSMSSYPNSQCCSDNGHYICPTTWTWDVVLPVYCNYGVCTGTSDAASSSVGAAYNDYPVSTC